jgi:aspartyl-tRNA(Asn)/glutamyl-tRNA(Gln) amidotransferase subunit C
MSGDLFFVRTTRFPYSAIFAPFRATMSDQFNVRYTAQLARLHLTDAEIAKFQSQLGQVLSHVEQLRKVDVSEVAATAHANAVTNVFREDGARPYFSQDEALKNAPRSANGLIVVPKVIE